MVLNHSEACPNSVKLQNEKSYHELNQWKPPSNIQLEVKRAFDLSKKESGVGNARKLGLDHASKLLGPDDYLICFDADTSCSENYVNDILEQGSHHNADLLSIHFEHQIDDRSVEGSSIIQYECFLRYHINQLKNSAYPYAFQTIGSSMAVKNKTYKAFGGMNRRKAGEDFYFMHKIIPYRRIIEVTNCYTIPSSRTSDRVPFGTGKSVADQLNASTQTYYTYHPYIYSELAQLMEYFLREESYELGYERLSNTNRHYLASENFKNVLNGFIDHSKDHEQLKLKLFQWFNGLRSLKYMHFMRDEYYSNIPLKDALGSLEWTYGDSLRDRLMSMRDYDKKNPVLLDPNKLTQVKL